MATTKLVPLPVLADGNAERAHDLIKDDFITWACGQKTEYNKIPNKKRSDKRRSRLSSRRSAVSLYPLYIILADQRQLYERRLALLIHLKADKDVMRSFRALHKDVMSDDESDFEIRGACVAEYTVCAHISRHKILADLMTALDNYASTVGQQRGPVASHRRKRVAAPIDNGRTLKPGLPEGTYAADWLTGRGLEKAPAIQKGYEGNKLNIKAIVNLRVPSMAEYKPFRTRTWRLTWRLLLQTMTMRWTCLR